MPDFRDTRNKLKISMIAMGVVDVIAIGVLLSPWIGSTRSRTQELDTLWKELQVKTKQVEPLRGLDKKIVVADGQINEFYKTRLTAQDSAISEELGKVASQSGVKISGIKYKLEDPSPVGLRPMQIEAELSGDYLQLVRFINALERDQLFFLINGVDLGSEQNGIVKLQMKLQTYVKVGA
jgi:type IV pilus assembly protein PilO